MSLEAEQSSRRDNGSVEPVKEEGGTREREAPRVGGGRRARRGGGGSPATESLDEVLFWTLGPHGPKGKHGSKSHSRPNKKHESANQPYDSSAPSKQVLEYRTRKLAANRPRIRQAYIGYIKGRSVLPSGTSSKLYLIVVLSKAPKSLFGDSFLVRYSYPYQLSAFCLGTSGHSESPKPLEDERRQNQQNQQQVDLDLNATANASQESAGRNTETGGTQNCQPNPNGNNPRGRRSTSAFDRLGLGQLEPLLFGGIGLDDTQIMQDLRHRMQVMEREVKELQKENTELKNVAQDLRARRRSPIRRRERSRSHSPSQRRPRSPPRRRRRQNSSESPDSSSDESHEERRRRSRRYKRMRNRDGTPLVDGHTPLSSRILKVQLPKGFLKPTDMKYDGSTDPYVHLNDFEHRMICDGAIDEVKCRAFPVALTGSAARWFTSLPAGF
ncbi:hypothetical protein PIB30_017229 [Stylosanthes scabra]|uniref:Uncharacterized protein n=1 Tax=Stylosanthes scabra TaxID=79078 RepID=A0ABU6Z820_9FABA|nr:hypothetical protein [Stylosanthes scabra]